MQRRSTNTKQSARPSNIDSASQQAGVQRRDKKLRLQHRHCDTGCVFTQQQPLLCFFCPLHPTYVNKNRRKRTNGEKAYIYTFVQKRHMEPRHYWCSVYTPTRCRDHVFSSFILPKTPLKAEEKRCCVFLYIEKGVFVGFLFTTRRGSTESLWKKLYNRHEFCPSSDLLSLDCLF